jgi:hypothetical protein
MNLAPVRVEHALGRTRPRTLLCLSQGGQGMAKSFVVLSGTGVRDMREWVPSATTALQLVRTPMKHRRPGVRIEDERGNPISFFQLKDMAALESRRKNSPQP